MTDLIQLYPALANIPDIAELAASHAVLHMPANHPVFSEGQPCQGFPLLMQGRIRVYKQAESGREIELYRIEAGESCIVTTSCLISHCNYQARAVTETDVTLCLLPANVFRQSLATPEFRDYVLNLFADRMTDLMERVEEIAFHRLDARLASRLLGHGHSLNVTHAQLANELGSVREIISRLLKNFEHRQLIRLGREQIEIIDPIGLRRMAEEQK